MMQHQEIERKFRPAGQKGSASKENLARVVQLSDGSKAIFKAAK
jgi:hypothetical protein